MEKCASHSAHAGESNATFTGPVGLLLTQPPSVLSIHPHHIGFSQKLRTHTHMGSVFRSTSTHAGKSTEIQKNVEKCAFDSAHRVGPGSVEFQFWVFFSLSTPTCIPPTVMCPHHCPSRLCSIIGNFAKMNKNRKKYGKMWERLGACRGVECNLYQPDWPPSHQSTLHSFHTSPPHWIFRKLRTNTHTRVRFFVKIDPCWKINRNSEKCGKMCIRLSAQGWPGWCRFSILGVFFVFHTQTPDPLGIHSTPCGLASAGFCKNE